MASGLSGIVAGHSAISTVGLSGRGLTYRGYSIEDLASGASFEEVAYLLHYGELPQHQALMDYQKKLIELRVLPEALKTLLKLIPKEAHPMDVLRTACSFLGSIEPKRAPVDIADRLLALFPGVICYWYAYHFQQKEISGLSDEPSTGGHFLSLLHGKKPNALQTTLMNVSLILYAEHDFNASTFAARVTISTESDFYSAITSAIGTLRGPLHGGANEAAMELIQGFNSPEEVEKQLKDMLANKVKIMGFGHRVYRDCDPRSDIIKQWAYKIGQETQTDLSLYHIAERIEKLMWNEKKLFPNLDFYSAIAYHYCEIPTFLFTPIFVISRITGWSAHILEQSADNKLIRPMSEYIGPDNKVYPSITERH